MEAPTNDTNLNQRRFWKSIQENSTFFCGYKQGRRLRKRLQIKVRTLRLDKQVRHLPKCLQKRSKHIA